MTQAFLRGERKKEEKKNKKRKHFKNKICTQNNSFLIRKKEIKKEAGA